MVRLQSNDQPPQQLRCLLDSGSQIEVITEEAFNRLKAPYIYEETIINGVGGLIQSHKKVKVLLTSENTNYEEEIELIVIPEILSDQPTTSFQAHEVDTPAKIELAGPQFYKKDPIELLLGARFFYDVIEAEQARIGRGPTFQKSKLGWLACGMLDQVGILQETWMHTSTKVNVKQQDELSRLFQKFWQLEDTNQNENEVPPPLHRELEGEFSSSTRLNTEGRYIVKIPFTEEFRELGNSREQAYRRLMSLERRLQANDTLRGEYNKFMQEYIELGHMVPVCKHKEKNVVYYIPYSCVVKPDSSTTKLRVKVFDASAKTTTGKSLNDIQAVGPVIQRDQFDLAIEFRGDDVVLSADIAKMYRQVLIEES
ncbi:uncharacterized protein LOC129766354 [Toxorhynchites rutilus septentrionalis]|uniref:uncharacterized protein LOC129766354 n=1 Tax=Toxorhynchites rutilus septentrionalis TaxID=329112 RepID=UPI00247A4A39|nr:uncharacterized protein LOC129766354 [Toxorhynchites rutilus septentrionalis]